MGLEFAPRNYSLTGLENSCAARRGLVTTQWYACPIPRKKTQPAKVEAKAVYIRIG